MATRRDAFNVVPAAGAMLASKAEAQEAPDVSSWSRPSLVIETVTGP
jgi:hypothetical protein